MIGRLKVRAKKHNRRSDPFAVAVEDIEPRQLAGEGMVHFVCERAYGERLSSPRYLTGGVLLQKTREKINTKLLICNDL